MEVETLCRGVEEGGRVLGEEGIGEEAGRVEMLNRQVSQPMRNKWGRPEDRRWSRLSSETE